MAFSIVRKATQEDKSRLRSTAMRFGERHDIRILPDDDPVSSITGFIDYYRSSGGSIEYEEAVYLAKLWRACARRALRHPLADAIAYDNVGYHVD